MKKPMNKLSKFLMGVMIITTSLVDAQNDCVKRVNRYTEAPSVVTIYPCNSVGVTSESGVKYSFCILVDSIYKSEKFYRLSCNFSSPVEDPIFYVELISGQTVVIFTRYTAPDFMYSEATLSVEQLDLIKVNSIVNVSVWHKGLKDTPNPKIPCSTYFKDFVTRY